MTCDLAHHRGAYTFLLFKSSVLFDDRVTSQIPMEVTIQSHIVFSSWGWGPWKLYAT